MRVTWTAGTALPEQATVFETWRKRPVAKEEVTQNVGDAKAALDASARRVKATYDFAVQTHATIGPSCAVADFQDGKLTVWTRRRRPTRCSTNCLSITGLPREAIRLVFIEGAGCYGRNGTEDAAADASLISTIIGQPVRVQWSRADETARSPKSPPRTMDMEAGLDAQGNVVAWTGDFYIALNHIAAFKPLDFPLLAATRDRPPAARQLGRLPVPEFGAALPVSERPGEHAAHRRGVLPLLAFAQSGAHREQLRQRGVHGRARGGGECRSGRVPPALPQGSARDRRRAGRHEAGGLAGAAGAESGRGQRTGRQGARHLVSALQQRDHLCGGRRRSRGEQGDRRDSRHAGLRQPRLRRDGQPGRRCKPGRRRRAANSQPHADGGGDLGPQQGHERRLGELSDHAPHPGAESRGRADRSSGDGQPGARASRWRARSRRLSRTRCSTRPARACARSRSRRTRSRRRSREHRRAEAREASQTRSIASDTPWPTPTHMVASARLPPIFSS